jgi:hypothetical protein
MAERSPQELNQSDTKRMSDALNSARAALVADAASHVDALNLIRKAYDSAAELFPEKSVAYTTYRAELREMKEVAEVMVELEQRKLVSEARLASINDAAAKQESYLKEFREIMPEDIVTLSRGAKSLQQRRACMTKTQARKVNARIMMSTLTADVAIHELEFMIDKKRSFFEFTDESDAFNTLQMRIYAAKRFAEVSKRPRRIISLVLANKSSTASTGHALVLVIDVYSAPRNTGFGVFDGEFYVFDPNGGDSPYAMRLGVYIPQHLKTRLRFAEEVENVGPQRVLNDEDYEEFHSDDATMGSCMTWSVLFLHICAKRPDLQPTEVSNTMRYLVEFNARETIAYLHEYQSFMIDLSSGNTVVMKSRAVAKRPNNI